MNRNNVLFIDDERPILNSLQRYLRIAGVEWDSIFVTGGKEGLAVCKDTKIDLIVVDGKMPGMSGCEFLEALNKDIRNRDIPTIMLTGYDEDKMRKKALNLGVIEFLNKPIVPEEFIIRLRNVLRMKIISDELKETRMQVIRRLGKAAEYKDDDTGAHVIRVAHYCRIIAEELNLPEEQVELIFLTAPMHDIGKIGIPDSILKKPGALNPGEFEIMRNHASLGEDVLHPLTKEEMTIYKRHTVVGQDILSEEKTPLLSMASTIAVTHHEKWDGTGYPVGLKGEDIPIEGRIVAIADIFDALANKRSYKEAFPVKVCLSIINELKGNHLDPEIVDAFNKNISKILEMKRMIDG